MYKKLRKIRLAKDIKVREIAKKLGLKTTAAYYKKETGAVPFTLKEGKIVADMFEMPIETIFFK